MTPDHRTPIALRTHSREPVPFVIWGSGVAADSMACYGEGEAAKGSLQLEYGHQMMEYLIGRRG